MLNKIELSDPKYFHYTPRLLTYIGEGEHRRAVSVDYVIKNKALERLHGVKTRDELDKIVLESAAKDIEYPRNSKYVKFDRLKSAVNILKIIGFAGVFTSLAFAPLLLFNGNRSIKELYNLKSLSKFALLTIPLIILNDYVCKVLPRVEFNTYGKRENTGSSNAAVEILREIKKDITNPFR